MFIRQPVEAEKTKEIEVRLSPTLADQISKDESAFAWCSNPK